MTNPFSPRKGRLATIALLPLAAFALLAFQCQPVSLPRSGAQLYLSPQVAPMALSNDGTRLYVANTTSGTLSVLDLTNPLAPTRLAELKVGHDPTSVAVLPGLVDGDELVFVVNHISDSISVVSRNKLAIVQTIQQLDADGVTQTDEPVSIAFAGASRAFVTLDQPNQVLVLDIDAQGHATINPTRLAITAQAPRALAVSGGKLFVTPFESGNQTEFPTCFPDDPRGLGVNENDSIRSDEGCEMTAELIAGINPANLQLQLGTIFQFAAQDPNIGGRVIRDTDLPDRDLFVFDAQTLALEQTVDTLGTMLSGLAAHELPVAGPLPVSRLWVAHTEARNEIDGLGALDNHLFENRVAVIDCIGSTCTPTTTVDLDASAAAAGLGQTVPNPWGIAVSGDGNTVVVTAAAADGDPGDGRPPMHGVFTLDGDGNVQGSALVGALPEGVVRELGRRRRRAGRLRAQHRRQQRVGRRPRRSAASRHGRIGARGRPRSDARPDPPRSHRLPHRARLDQQDLRVRHPATRTATSTSSSGRSTASTARTTGSTRAASSPSRARRSRSAAFATRCRCTGKVCSPIRFPA